MMWRSFPACLSLVVLFVGGCSLFGGSEDTASYGLVVGYVNAPDGTPLFGVDVSTDEAATTTNEQGYFSLDGVSPGVGRVVRFRMEGFVPTARIVDAQQGHASFLRVTMHSVGYTSTIDALSGGQVQSPQGGAVDIPAGGLVDGSGNPYQGQASVAVTVFDPTTEEGKGAFPGEYKGITSTGEEVPFASFGFMDVTVTDQDGNPLQLAAGEQATITIPVPQGLRSIAPATMPMWYFDPSDGRWYEEAEGTFDGSAYSGKVSHFSIWNNDVGYDRSYLTGRIVDCTTGLPVECARVTARGISPRNCWDSGERCTGPDGVFTIPVDANAVVEVWAERGGAESQHMQINSAPKGETLDLGDICLGVPQLQITLVWSEEPSDLDLHATFPAEGGREHVYFGNLSSADGSVSQNTDDVDGYGPEIITAYRLRDGIWRFAVHHFGGMGTICTSGARVNLVVENMGIYDLTPPSGGCQGENDVWLLWDVTVSSGAVTSVKRLGNVLNDVVDESAFNP
ncbi:MAG: hypothetical protein D6806_13800 [Deltaproteobacteria bacterium]|nr:MAG: hypothetical protein D6806_13800 [Deltaproteobacteria bacterium]